MKRTSDWWQCRIPHCLRAWSCSASRDIRDHLPSLLPTARSRLDCARMVAPEMCHGDSPQPTATCQPPSEIRSQSTSYRNKKKREGNRSITPPQFITVESFLFSYSYSSLFTLHSSATKFQGINPSFLVVKCTTRHQSDSVSSITSIRSPFIKLTSVSSRAV